MNHPADAVLPFPGFFRLVPQEIIDAEAGMGVDHPEGGVLLHQVGENARENGVLDHIGKIAGMECVAVIHRSVTTNI